MGISKGLAMSRIINAIAAREAHEAVQYDFVLVAGHFLVRDENIFTFFEGQSLKVSLAPTSSAVCLHPSARNRYAVHSKVRYEIHPLRSSLSICGELCTTSPVSITMIACRQDEGLGHHSANV